jgi:hypothetical protein
MMTDDKDVFKKAGAKGGEARARNLTTEERSELARKAVRARWDKAGTSSSAGTTTSKSSEYRTAVFPLREGDARLTFPASVSASSAQTLIQHFNLTMKEVVAQAEERDGKAGNRAPDEKK